MADEFLPENARLPLTFRYLLHAVNLRHGTDGFASPSEDRRADDFFALKNPTASVGFELANLGTKGQRATCRPPKPLIKECTKRNIYGTLIKPVVNYTCET